MTDIQIVIRGCLTPALPFLSAIAVRGGRRCPTTIAEARPSAARQPEKRPTTAGVDESFLVLQVPAARGGPDRSRA